MRKSHNKLNICPCFFCGLVVLKHKCHANTSGSCLGHLITIEPARRTLCCIVIWLSDGKPHPNQKLLVAYVLFRRNSREFVRFVLLSASPAQRQAFADHLNIILDAISKPSTAIWLSKKIWAIWAPTKETPPFEDISSPESPEYRIPTKNQKRMPA